MRLTVLGATDTVTGSRYLLEHDGHRILVDCGLFQGPKKLRDLNWRELSFAAAGLDAVVLTHAHIDHSGQLPKLVRHGFRGPIHATEGTAALCEIMLADCGHIQEMEVEHLNRRNAQRGKPLVEPIYTAKDAQKTMRFFSTVDYGEWIKVAKGVRARWWDAGHILGSASVEIEALDDKGAPLRLLFSGDLGSGGRDFLGDPQGPDGGLDYLVMESTYGGVERRTVTPDERRKALAAELVAAHKAGGPMLMPAFAIERTQELLTDLLAIIDSGAAPRGEIFLDSPLAIRACEIFVKHGDDNSLGINPFARLREQGALHFLEKPWESDRLEKVSGWHIIMAGSGMCDAGRIRRHLKRLLWRREVTVLLSGFQAQGTLGRLLADGRRSVRIQGEAINVRAHIRSLDVYSGHADGPHLKAWAQARGPVGGKVFLTHGEPENLEALRTRLTGTFPEEALAVPTLDQSFALEKTAAALQVSSPRLAAQPASGLDWHNARSELLARLDQAMEEAGSDAEREDMLKKLAAVMGGGPGTEAS
jgi:metallo-beta-lactamase family protein